MLFRSFNKKDQYYSRIWDPKTNLTYEGLDIIYTQYDMSWIDKEAKLKFKEPQLKTYVSSSGSTGIGQLVRTTGRNYGLKVPDAKTKTDDPAVDERLDPIKNIDASLKYMAHLNEKYKGDPQLIAVGYNQGEKVLDKHLKNNDGKLVPDNLRQEIAADLTDKGKLSAAQINQKANEPVTYLAKTVNSPAFLNQSSLTKGESFAPQIGRAHV